MLPILALLFFLFTVTLAIPREIEQELRQLVKRGGKCSATTQSRITAGVKGIDKSIAYTKEELIRLNRIDSAERAERSRHVKLSNHKRGLGFSPRYDDVSEIAAHILARAISDTDNYEEAEPHILARDLDATSSDDLTASDTVPVIRLFRRKGSSYGSGTTHTTTTTNNVNINKYPNKEIGKKVSLLQGTFTKAVDQRKANQHTLPSSNLAQKDLKTYGERQVGAGKNIMKLTGDYSKDYQLTKTLRAGFAGGTKLNEGARLNALSQCKRDLERLDWIQENYFP